MKNILLIVSLIIFLPACPQPSQNNPVQNGKKTDQVPDKPAIKPSENQSPVPNPTTSTTPLPSQTNNDNVTKPVPTSSPQVKESISPTDLSTKYPESSSHNNTKPTTSVSITLKPEEPEAETLGSVSISFNPAKTTKE